MSIEIENKQELTRRTVNPGAEKWIGEPIKVLDHGFLVLQDYMGDDLSVEEAARISYREGTRKVSETVGLIRYLRRKHHTSPFEMAVLKFHAKMPIVVARQWVRHRTASINEESARYSILSNEFYIPQPQDVSMQASSNRQGRGEAVAPDYAEKYRNDLKAHAINTYELYEYYLNTDDDGKPIDENRPQLAREIARLPLGVDVYTQWIWTCDLHNIFHFLRLRMDEHAQLEIRQYANAMGQIIADAYPISWKAFEDYELFATQLSRPEMEVLTTLLKAKDVNLIKEDVLRVATELGFTNVRERKEFLDKLRNFKLLD